MKNKCRAIEKQKRLNFEVEISPIMFMRQLSFGIVVFAIFFISACAISEPSYDVPRKAILNQNAPGTVWLMKNLFLDKSEICNLDYLEYLHWCYRKDKVQYKKAMPDTACWLNSEFNYKCLVAYYLRYTFNRDYPVVGLSFSQAQSYCKWRTDRVNEVAYMVEHHLKSLPDSGLIIPQRVIFRLPTSEEWEYAAMAGLNYKKYPLGYEKLFFYSTMTKENLNYQLLSKIDCDPQSQPTVSSTSGYPNRFGLYHLLGNVSEMVADSLYKGLNYTTYIDGKPLTQVDYNHKMSFKYTQPEPWLGFRCICEVKDYKYDASETILNDLIVGNEFDSTYLKRLKRDTNFAYYFYPGTFKNVRNKGIFMASHEFFVKNVQTENPADSLFLIFTESNLYNKTKVKETSCAFLYYYFPSNARLAKQKFKELDRYLTKMTRKRTVGPILIYGGKPKEHEKEISYVIDNDKGGRCLILTLDFDIQSNMWFVEIY